MQRPQRAIYVYCGRGFPRFDARRLLGLTEEAATSQARKHECQLRVVEENGHLLPITANFVPGRIDVAVEGGHVVRIKFVG